MKRIRLNEMPRRHPRAWHGSNFQRLDGDAPRAILVGRVVSRRLDCVPGLNKQVKNFLAATKFCSKVHPSVYGIDRGSGTLDGKPFGEPLDWRSLGAKSGAVKERKPLNPRSGLKITAIVLLILSLV
jgi:hypothetical protein